MLAEKQNEKIIATEAKMSRRLKDNEHGEATIITMLPKEVSRKTTTTILCKLLLGLGQ